MLSALFLITDDKGNSSSLPVRGGVRDSRRRFLNIMVQYPFVVRVSPYGRSPRKINSNELLAEKPGKNDPFCWNSNEAGPFNANFRQDK
jgi:hypothetical protein